MRLKPSLYLLLTVSASLILHGYASAQKVNIKIIETSDVHGALVPFDLIYDTSTTSSLAQVHTYVVSQRNKKNQEVILLDNGDLIQGDPLSYYYNFVNTTGSNAFAEALNFMGYDAATIGNHDIEAGHDVYDNFRYEIKLPWLAANAININSGEPYFEPYTIIERSGIRIAVLGLTTPGVTGWLPEKLWSGIEFEDMIESAEKWVEIIKAKENPDLLVGLFHAGVDYTYSGENEDTYKNENASRLVAERVPGFDVVFVGHDHAGWNFKIVNEDGDSVLILGPLSRARTIAVANIQLEFDSSLSKWNKKSISGKIVETKNYKPDDHFMSMFLYDLNVVKNYVNRPIGQLKSKISSKESLFGPSTFVDLIHNIQLDITNADISFTSPLSFNAEIDSGWIYVKDIFKLYHYENYLYTMSLTGEEIKNYLEFSYGNWFNEMKDENNHLLLFKKDNDGNIKYSSRYGTPETEERFYNYSSAAGINYFVDVSKPAGERIIISSFSDGRLFYSDSSYLVAINSYRGSGGGGHLTRGAGIPQEDLKERIVSSTDKEFRHSIINWIEEKKVITPEIISTWKAVPEDWWRRGRDKDYMLLFDEAAPLQEIKSIGNKSQ
ncbi:MAG: bifunctional metallophosphatase/5'-nucleotidase [bacterium]|nr:bifunctional metallophosphatase/5'-nucleotidase [bacterium]